jgi:hypothetical protein
MVGAQAHFAIGDVDIFVGDVEVADATLRSTGGNFCDGARGGTRWRLLWETWFNKENGQEQKQTQARPAALDRDKKESAHAANCSLKTKC